jgi:transposase
VQDVITYVGIDAHKKDLFVAMLIGHDKTPVTWQLANEPQAVRRLVRKLEREAPGPVQVFYEAGPCGYALQRQLTTPRVHCDVVAPALIPRPPGERVKTNRRDARKLVELGRAALLTAVQPPTPADEAVRDLARARDDAREDLQRCRHRLGKLLLRRGLHFAGRNWTRAHRAWIDGLTWMHAAERAVVDDYLLALDQTEARFHELDVRLAALAEAEPYREPVGWLRCFRGVDTLTAILILAELHDFRRFASPRALMAYLGLVPGEHSSGEKHRRGRITRTGNALVRRVLVETAWHYQHRPSIGVALTRRRTGQPARVIGIADKAQQRLCRRFRKLAAEHKPAQKIAVAIARELAGFLWAALQPAPAAASATAR